MRRVRRPGDGLAGVDAYEHGDGSLLIPIGSPPSWSASYFYVVNHRDELSEPFEPLRCLRLDDRDVRRSTSKVRMDHAPDRSIFVAVGGALDSPSGFVVPWEIRVGAHTIASLCPPPWLVFAPSIGQGFVSHAVERVRPDALARERDLRLRQRDRSMRSAPLLDHIRNLGGRRLIVEWFEGDDVWKQSTFQSGRELLEGLTDGATRDRAHLIHFPDGWYVDGVDWLL